MLPLRIPSSRFCGKYVTRSDTSARARRRAFAFGSFARNGLIGTRVGVPDGEREPVGVAPDVEAGGVRVATGAPGVGWAVAAGGVPCVPNDGRITGAVCRGGMAGGV